MWRLQRASETDLQGLVRQFGLTAPDVPLRTALPFGMSSATPQRAQALLHAVLHITRQNPAPARLPLLIASVEELRGHQVRFIPQKIPVPTVTSPPTVTYLRAVLERVLTPGATASRLYHWHSAEHPAVDLHLQKPGPPVRTKPKTLGLPGVCACTVKITATSCSSAAATRGNRWAAKSTAVRSVRWRVPFWRPWASSLANLPIHKFEQQSRYS